MKLPNVLLYLSKTDVKPCTGRVSRLLERVHDLAHFLHAVHCRSKLIRGLLLLAPSSILPRCLLLFCLPYAYSGAKVIFQRFLAFSQRHRLFRLFSTATSETSLPMYFSFSLMEKLFRQTCLVKWRSYALAKFSPPFHIIPCYHEKTWGHCMSNDILVLQHISSSESCCG